MSLVLNETNFLQEIASLTNTGLRMFDWSCLAGRILENFLKNQSINIFLIGAMMSVVMLTPMVLQVI